MFYGWDEINLALESNFADDDSADKEARQVKTIDLVANFASRISDFFGPSVRSEPPHIFELNDLLREGLDSLYPGRFFPPMPTFQVASQFVGLYLRCVDTKPSVAHFSFQRGKRPKALGIKEEDSGDARKKRKMCCLVENEVSEDVAVEEATRRSDGLR